MIKVSGDLGLLRVGYQQAIVIGGWSLTCKQETLGAPVSYMTAVVRSLNDYWVNREPKRMGLWMGSSWWVWDHVVVHTPIIEGRTVEIELEGNPKSEDKF